MEVGTGFVFLKGRAIYQVSEQSGPEDWIFWVQVPALAPISRNIHFPSARDWRASKIGTGADKFEQKLHCLGQEQKRQSSEYNPLTLKKAKIQAHTDIKP